MRIYHIYTWVDGHEAHHATAGAPHGQAGHGATPVQQRWGGWGTPLAGSDVYTSPSNPRAFFGNSCNLAELCHTSSGLYIVKYTISRLSILHLRKHFVGVLLRNQKQGFLTTTRRGTQRMATAVGILKGQSIPHKALRKRDDQSTAIQEFLAFIDALNRGQV